MKVFLDEFFFCNLDESVPNRSTKEFGVFEGFQAARALAVK